MPSIRTFFLTLPAAVENAASRLVERQDQVSPHEWIDVGTANAAGLIVNAVCLERFRDDMWLIYTDTDSVRIDVVGATVEDAWVAFTRCFESAFVCSECNKSVADLTINGPLCTRCVHSTSSPRRKRKRLGPSKNRV